MLRESAAGWAVQCQLMTAGIPGWGWGEHWGYFDRWWIEDSFAFRIFSFFVKRQWTENAKSTALVCYCCWALKDKFLGLQGVGVLMSTESPDSSGHEEDRCATGVRDITHETCHATPKDSLSQILYWLLSMHTPGPLRKCWKPGILAKSWFLSQLCSHSEKIQVPKVIFHSG